NALLWKNVEFWRRSDPFIELKDDVFALDGEPRFPSERYCLQRFPSIKTPARQAVPVKMPTDVHVAPGINSNLKVLFQERLDIIPIPIVEKRMWNERAFFQAIDCSGMFDFD